MWKILWKNIEGVTRNRETINFPQPPSKKAPQNGLQQKKIPHRTLSLVIIQVLSRLTVKNLMRKQAVLRKKRCVPLKTKNTPDWLPTEGYMVRTFFSAVLVSVIQKTFLQIFMTKKFNSSLMAPSRRVHAVKRFF